MAERARLPRRSSKKSSDISTSGLSTEGIRQQYPYFSELLFKIRDEILGMESKTRIQLGEQVMSSPGDVGDSSVLDTTTDYFLSLADTQQHELVEIKDAFERMHRGVYGICESCESPIATERLKKMPYASMCIDCKSALEAETKATRLQIIPKI